VVRLQHTSGPLDSPRRRNHGGGATHSPQAGAQRHWQASGRSWPEGHGPASTYESDSSQRRVAAQVGLQPPACDHPLTPFVLLNLNLWPLIEAVTRQGPGLAEVAGAGQQQLSNSPNNAASFACVPSHSSTTPGISHMPLSRRRTLEKFAGGFVHGPPGRKGYVKGGLRCAPPPCPPGGNGARPVIPPLRPRPMAYAPRFPSRQGIPSLSVQSCHSTLLGPAAAQPGAARSSGSGSITLREEEAGA